MARKMMKGMEAGILHTGEKAKGGTIEGKENTLVALAKPACSQ